jgi:hypothetical protein
VKETGIKCNVCGKEFDFFDSQEDFKIHSFCGYGTKFDGSVINMHICCDCLEKIVDSCAISPVRDPSDD